MSDKKTKSFIRGGQLFLYNTRMFTQVAGRITKWAILIYLLLVVVLMCFLTEYQDMRELGMQVYSYILNWIGMGSVHVYTDPTNLSSYMTAHFYVTNALQQNYVAAAFSNFIQHLAISLASAFVIYLGVTKLFTTYFIKVGDKHSDDQMISGTRLAKSVKETIKSVKNSKLGSSDIKIANTLPLPKFSEFQGILYHGSTGSGKTEGIKRLLDEIRASGDPAIIYDKECTLKPYFFDESMDKELNPLSALCENWDIWEECANPIEMAAIAVYLMPKSVQGSDPFWVDAARTIFSTVAWEMRTQEDRSIIKLLQVLLTTTLDELRGILDSTEAENLVSKDIEKTAISIRAVMATYTKSLRFLEGLERDKNKPSFSIKRWVKEQSESLNEKKGWLFISSRANYHAEIKPLISAWIGMSMKAIQTLKPTTRKRFWIIVDEMASLNRLEDFSDIAADIRKFGGCIVIGIHSITQLEFIYGRDEATAITDLFNTSNYYRSPKSRVAEWVSKDLGEQIVEEVRESQSYGPNAIRDGNTIARQRVTRPTVDTGTIMQLEDLNFYVRLVGSHPITRMHSPYVENREQTIEHALIEREIDWDAIKKVSSSAAKAEKHPDRDVAVKVEQASNKQNEAVSNNADLMDDPRKLETEINEAKEQPINNKLNIGGMNEM
ncbi:type IV conjugative transfer system coupling protein TraD [Francisellaceae bacterium]|nr:type IV conjugative transfer system coupling protein TraD [Francisellaceae bacterium]